MAEFDPPDTVYGVDFSAAARDAGRETWIAECTPNGDELHVDCLADVANRPGCDTDRDSTLDYLVGLIRESADERRAFGLDFPFGLPESLLAGDDWHDFVEGAADGEWGALVDVEGPRSLYDGAEDRVDAREDLLRETDEEHGGQEPTGFRIKTQTFYGISGVLAEVADDVSIVPMDESNDATETVVLETYPAGVFRRLVDDGNVDAYDTGYKRDTRESIERRQTNVCALTENGVEFGDHCECAIASDNALDAVAAAYATWRASQCGYRPDDLLTESGDVEMAYAVEGYIYC